MLVSIVLVVYGALLEHTTIALHSNYVTSFWAPVREGLPLALFVVDGETVKIHGAGFSDTIEINLQSGTSAFDVYDFDEDGVSEIIAVCGDKILQYKLSADAPTSPPSLLFTTDSIFSKGRTNPVPLPLVFQVENHTAIGLPTEDGFEFRTFDGKLIRKEKAETPQDKSYGRGLGFSVVASTRGPVTSEPVVFRVRNTIEMDYSLPNSLVAEDVPIAFRKIPLAHLTFRDTESFTAWPWFPLSSSGDISARVYYTIALPAMHDTKILILENMQTLADGKNATKVRNDALIYPGRIIPLGEMLPDFNGDGYTDILLWSTTAFSNALDFVPKLLTDELVQVHVGIHLYNPDIRRYEAKASARIVTSIPFSRLVFSSEDSCFANVIFPDLNGDGFTDCVWSPQGNDLEFHLWDPDQNTLILLDKFRFGEPVDKVLNCQAPEAPGNSSVVMKAGNSIHLFSLPAHKSSL